MSLPTALGIDAGGTASRWALLGDDGTLAAQGQVGPLSGLMLNNTDGKALFDATLNELRHQMGKKAMPNRVVIGLTGIGEDPAGIAAVERAAADGLQVLPQSVQAMSDQLLAHQAHFAPGQGIVVYAGTGSYASYWNTQCDLQRVGGKGLLLDDAGGGFWMGLQALRCAWRHFEEGTQHSSALARAVFAQLVADHGGSDWAATRKMLYSQDLGSVRGDVASLCKAVLESAGQDVQARAILEQAGHELARLARVMLHQHGDKPLVAAGGVFTRLPPVWQAFEARLRTDFQGSDLDLRQSQVKLHWAAAQLALAALSGDAS
jgi:N-acetylglucosamine kinase-like BadF-type ATPase